MSKSVEDRIFFILCNNGDTFYFNINKDGEIFCNEFNYAYKAVNGKNIPAAYSLSITENDFQLIGINGEILYSLKDYCSINPNLKNEKIAVETLYIDEDIRTLLLESNKITYDETASQIPGLLTIPAGQTHIKKKSR